MEQGSADAREGSNKRSPMGLAGMFPFLQPRASVETDQCNRMRKSAGGKVKPGQPMLRTDSGDLATTDSQSANSSASNSPSRVWMTAAGSREGALHQSWPGPNHTGNASKGLFSKLMSKKNKRQDAASPASPQLETSPNIMQLGINSELKASGSIEALHMAVEQLRADDSCPSTPTTSKGLADPRDSDEGGFVSCYATPVDSEVMDSPASNLIPEGYSANATLDLCQQMAFESGGEGVPVMDMARELPEVFTPGFSQLLQGGSRLQAVQHGSPSNSPYGDLEPTVALVSAAQLAQAGCMQEQPSSVLLHSSQDGDCSHGTPTSSAATPACHAQDVAPDVGCAIQQQQIVAAAVAAAQAANEQQEHQQQNDQGSSQPVSSEDVTLEMVSTAADTAKDDDEHAAAAAAAVMSAGTALTVHQSLNSPTLASIGDLTDTAAVKEEATTAAAAGHMAQNAGVESTALEPLAQQPTPQQQANSTIAAAEEVNEAACSNDQHQDRPEIGTAGGPLLAATDQPAEGVAVQHSTAVGVAVPAEATLQPATAQTLIPSPATTANQSHSAPADQPSSSGAQTGQQLKAEATVGTDLASCPDSSNSAGPVAVPEGFNMPPAILEVDMPLSEEGTLEEEASFAPPTAEDSIPSVGSEVQAELSQPQVGTSISEQAAVAARSHTYQRKMSPMAVVRESMPLFVSDPTRAMGSPLRLDTEDDSLDAQDMQLLPQTNSSTSSRSTAAAMAGVPEGVSSAGVHPPRLLTHGAAQRVAVGKGAAGGFLGALAPVEEASFTSCSPEESPTSAMDNAGSSGRSSPQYEGVEVGMAAMSPLRNRQPGGSTPQMTPAAADRLLELGMSPGSTYSTPVLAVQGGHHSNSVQGATPQSAVSSAIGSAIRAVPSTSNAADSGMELSPAMPGMEGPSPTLMLLPTLTGQGLSTTKQGSQEGDNSTPSLLDARAASPSAVYGMRFTATPFRGALAALPLDAALHAPLVDSSPFNLTDDGGMDTVCLADEAQRLAQNLAAAAGGFGPGSPAAQIPTSSINQAEVATPSSPGGRSAGAGSPTDELRDLHVVMLTKQLAEVQKRSKELEVENLRLREQVEIYEFEKTELNSQEEMEKQARQYAEEQLQQLQVETQQLLQAKSAQASQMLSMRQEFEGFQQEAQRQQEAMLQQHAALQSAAAQAQQERNEVLDRLNLLDMQLTAMRSNTVDLSAALEAQRQRCAELENVLAARDRDMAEAARLQGEAQAKVEKAMEQVIAANTAREHVKQKATDEISKVQQMLQERQQLLTEREKRVQEYQHLRQKYAQKSAALKEAEKRCQDKDAENQELMAMCDQLLQQQEAGRTGRTAGNISVVPSVSSSDHPC